MTLRNFTIKRDTEEGQRIRQAFAPGVGKGWLLGAADYSQIEARIMSYLDKGTKREDSI